MMNSNLNKRPAFHRITYQFRVRQWPSLMPLSYRWRVRFNIESEFLLCKYKQLRCISSLSPRPWKALWLWNQAHCKILFCVIENYGIANAALILSPLVSLCCETNNENVLKNDKSRRFNEQVRTFKINLRVWMALASVIFFTFLCIILNTFLWF